MKNFAVSSVHKQLSDVNTLHDFFIVHAVVHDEVHLFPFPSFNGFALNFEHDIKCCAGKVVVDTRPRYKGAERRGGFFGGTHG